MKGIDIEENKLECAKERLLKMLEGKNEEEKKRIINTLLALTA